MRGDASAVPIRIFTGCLNGSFAEKAKKSSPRKTGKGWIKCGSSGRGVVERRALPGPGTPEKDGILFFQDWENGIKLFFKSQRKEFIASLKEIQKVAMDAYAQLLVLPDIAALIELASTVDQRFATMKRKTNALDFDDLESLAIHLLEGDSAVRESYQRQFHAILVDESQDTNSLQLRLLDLIGRRGESARKLGLPPTPLLVHGGSQAIHLSFPKGGSGGVPAIGKEFCLGWENGEETAFYGKLSFLQALDRIRERSLLPRHAGRRKRGHRHSIR